MFLLALSSGDAHRSLRLANALLKHVNSIKKHDLPTKEEVIANIHSCIGNAHVELVQLPKALKHHQKDLEVSTKRYTECTA